MACLNALWELGEGNVEEVRVFVSRDRPLAYTTVLTLLDRLSRRSAVSRRKEGRGFRYQPAIDRDKLRRLAVGQLLCHHFSGSAESLRRFLDAEIAMASRVEEAAEGTIAVDGCPESGVAVGGSGGAWPAPTTSESGSDMSGFEK
jgi:predicted transcriptional regulator